MTNTEVEVEVMSAVWPVRTNQGLAEVIQRNIECVGMPEWSAAEQEFARRLQAAADAKPDGLKAEITPLLGESQQRAPSNDCGDVSWKVPMGRVSFPANIPNVHFHHWAAGAALATSIAHKGSVAGAKALAATVVDLLSDPALVQRAKDTFAVEIGDVTYRPLISADQKPPLDLNREMMESFRPAMRENYVKERPVFV
jgi:aminobenzoyl-glutamate utilization protein B